jgi:hypothetical protein
MNIIEMKPPAGAMAEIERQHADELAKLERLKAAIDRATLRRDAGYNAQDVTPDKAVPASPAAPQRPIVRDEETCDQCGTIHRNALRKRRIIAMRNRMNAIHGIAKVSERNLYALLYHLGGTARIPMAHAQQISENVEGKPLGDLVGMAVDDRTGELVLSIEDAPRIIRPNQIASGIIIP